MSINPLPSNHPRNFWQCQQEISDEIWQKAITESLPLLGLQPDQTELSEVLKLTLEENRFGPNHWRLGFPKRTYYFLKPFLPRAFTRLLRQIYQNPKKVNSKVPWPIDDRYVNFLWSILACVLRETSEQELSIKALWPDNNQYSFTLTHDVEAKGGVDFVKEVADLEESYGFRSSFNFVPEKYHVETALLDDLRLRGFEVGIHGLKHDGKLFSSHDEFDRRVVKINRYLKEYGAVGFRSPLTHRNPDWMQVLDVEYDLSFFDTDPFEPIPGGTMSIWPFFLGNFVELPYTLVQDYTLTSVLGETTPRIWLEKVDFLEKNHGMVLLNSHPDYLKQPSNLKIYSTFLSEMKRRRNYWHALPRDIAKWWRKRAGDISFEKLRWGTISSVVLVDGHIHIESN